MFFSRISMLLPPGSVVHSPRYPLFAAVILLLSRQTQQRPFQLFVLVVPRKTDDNGRSVPPERRDFCRLQNQPTCVSRVAISSRLLTSFQSHTQQIPFFHRIRHAQLASLLLLLLYVPSSSSPLSALSVFKQLQVSLSPAFCTSFPLKN